MPPTTALLVDSGMLKGKEPLARSRSQHARNDVRKIFGYKLGIEFSRLILQTQKTGTNRGGSRGLHPLHSCLDSGFKSLRSRRERTAVEIRTWMHVWARS